MLHVSEQTRYNVRLLQNRAFTTLITSKKVLNNTINIHIYVYKLFCYNIIMYDADTCNENNSQVESNEQ